MEQTKQERFDEIRDRVIAILKDMKVEDDPHFVFISQDVGHESEVRLITRSCPSFMMEQAIHLAQAGVEEQDKDDLTSGLDNLN